MRTELPRRVSGRVLPGPLRLRKGRRGGVPDMRRFCGQRQWPAERRLRGRLRADAADERPAECGLPVLVRVRRRVQGRVLAEPVRPTAHDGGGVQLVQRERGARPRSDRRRLLAGVRYAAQIQFQSCMYRTIYDRITAIHRSHQHLNPHNSRCFHRTACRRKA